MADYGGSVKGRLAYYDFTSGTPIRELTPLFNSEDFCIAARLELPFSGETVTLVSYVASVFHANHTGYTGAGTRICNEEHPTVSVAMRSTLFVKLLYYYQRFLIERTIFLAVGSPLLHIT